MRHLHRDYNTAHCGIDASHVLMTHVPAEADCPACQTAYTQYVAEKEARDAAEVLAEQQRREQDEQRLAERVAEIIAKSGAVE